MNAYKRHRFPHLGGPLNHQLRRLVVLLLQPEPPPLPRARGAGSFIEDLLVERGITVSYTPTASDP
jgi:hypothetical protein